MLKWWRTVCNAVEYWADLGFEPSISRTRGTQANRLAIEAIVHFNYLLA